MRNSGCPNFNAGRRETGLKQALIPLQKALLARSNSETGGAERGPTVKRVVQREAINPGIP